MGKAYTIVDGETVYDSLLTNSGRVLSQLDFLPHSVNTIQSHHNLILSFALEAAHLQEVNSHSLVSACKVDIGVLRTINCTMPGALLAFEVIIWYKTLARVHLRLTERLMFCISLGFAVLELVKIYSRSIRTDISPAVDQTSGGQGRNDFRSAIEMKEPPV